MWGGVGEGSEVGKGERGKGREHTETAPPTPQLPMNVKLAPVGPL